MGNTSTLGAILYEAESSWAESTSTFATHRIPTITQVDVSGLTEAMVASEFVQQRRQDGNKHIPGVQGGSFSMRLYWPGHGATMVGSPSVDAVETFLGIAVGNVALSLATSTTMTGGTASAPTTAAASGVSAGGLVRLGSLGDGDGNGQMYPVSTHAASTLNMLVDLDGAPANGQVVHPVVQLYPSTSPTTTSVTGTRFRILTGNLQYDCHGCYPTAFTVSGLSPGEIPTFDITFGVSRWTYANATFPSTVTSNKYVPAPIAGGSLHVQTVGTTTRNKITARNFQIEYTLGVTPVRGPGGVGAKQDIVGAVRTGDAIKVSFVADADATTTTPVIPGFFTSNVAKSIMWTGSTADSSAVGIWLPNVVPSDAVPTQIADDGINRLRFTGMAYNSATTTNDLTLAAIVMGSA